MKTKQDKSDINKLNNDAFLRASTINSRLSLLGHEFMDNIDNIVLNEKTGKTLGQIFNKKNTKNKTMYASSKFKLDMNILNSDDLNFDSNNIFIEEKQNKILYKGIDEVDEQSKKDEEEKKKTKGKREKEKENREIINDVFKNIENESNKKITKEMQAIYGLLDENGDTDYKKNIDDKNDNNNENERETKNECLPVRASTLFNDIFDFNQQEILDKQMKNINNKTRKNDLGLFNSLIPTEEKKDLNNKENMENNKDNIDNNISKINENENEEEKKKEVLKEEYYPIDVIEEAEKYYNLSNDSKEDLYPLNTYQMNHGLTIDFINPIERNLRTNIKERFSAIGVDNTSNSIYICTENGKIIKKTNINNEILINEQKYKENILCIDVFENNVFTGDESGNIIIWKDDKITQILINLNNKHKILFIKLIEIVQNKLILAFTDDQGDLYIVKVNPNKFGDYITNKILNNENIPIYNIIVFPNKKSEIKKEKKSIILLLASFQILGIYKIYLDNLSFDRLKIINYFYGEKGKYQFDISAGYGFPPVADLNKGKMGSTDIAAASRGSISNSIAIGDNENENSMVAVSYGKVIQLFGFRVSDKNEVYSKVIGYFINENPILRISFLFNSIISIISDDFKLKIVNTYDFIPKVFNPKSEHNPTTNCLISYELKDLSKYGIIGQEIEFTIENKNFKKYIYTNKIISIENCLYLLGKNSDKIYQCFLYNYDDVLNKLCQEEEYIKMLWLSLIIFNKNSNLLNKQLDTVEKDYIKNNKKKLLDSYLMIFFTKKIYPELLKKNEIYARMLIEFLIETDYFEILPEYIKLLSGENNLVEYIYINLTKYIINGNLIDINLNSYILSSFINYYIQKNDKLLLNKVLLKLNLDSLLQPEILSLIFEKELINPYIYTRIKNIQGGKKDYFLPAQYLDTVFKKEIIEKENQEIIKQNLSPEELKLYENQNENETDKIEKEKIKEDYKKLIIEHNLDYFNEKTFSCHNYIGHKFLWYCNKCICGKEYPNDTQMSPTNYKETAIKILSLLLIKENIKLYLEFDSYTYLKIITKFFLEPKLFNLIHNEGYTSGNNNKFSNSVVEVIDKYLGKKRSESFTGDFIFRTIRNVILKDVILNIFYVKYDFYIMTSEICLKSHNLFFDKEAIMEVLLFFADFKVEKFDEVEDPFNCHRKIKKEKEIKKYYKKIEEYMMNLINYLKEHNILDEDYIKKLLEKNRIEKYKKVYFYLCEEDKRYKQCFEMKLSEYEKNPDVFTEKNRKEFFNWIEHVLEFTYSYDNINEIYKKEQNKDIYIPTKKYHQEFKKLLLNHLKKLCEISVEELSTIADIWFYEEGEQEEVIHHLGGGNSNILQLRYIDNYFELKKEDMNDNIEKYIKFLEIEIDLLIKERNKRKIKQLITEYKILCNDTILKKLSENSINDCSIYICQIQGKVKEGVELTLNEVNQKYENILTILDKPNYNPILIDIELNEMYKYFEMGLNVCQNNFFDQEKESQNIDENWLILFKKACYLKINFNPKYEKNKNNIKTRDYKKIFDKLQNCIQLILDKMSDYITLDLLVDIISKNVEKGKTIQFYTFLDKSFYSFRRTESIYRSAKNLMSISVVIQYDNLGKTNTEGKSLCIDDKKCDFCHDSIKKHYKSAKMFGCGHIYHLKCCSEYKGEKVCHICIKEEKGDDLEKDENFKVNRIMEISDEEKENLKKIEEKIDEKKKKLISKGRLAVLKKMRKKRREINAVLNGDAVSL